MKWFIPPMNGFKYFFTRPSFAEGVGRLVDFTGLLSEQNENIISGDEVNFIEIENDWRLVGIDISNSIKEYEQEEKEEKKKQAVLVFSSRTE